MGMFTALTEMPGGKFPGGRGFAERPGGMFAGSSLISLLVFALELAFAFGAGLDPQPKPVMTTARRTRLLFDIVYLK